MRVLVTGANGFIGRHLCAAFTRREHEVRPIVRADFTNGRFDEALVGVDVVIHAAGETRAPTVARLRASNVDLTRRVLAAAASNHVQRFVLISSQAAAGPAQNRDIPVREDDAPRPIEAYGESKRDAEALVWSAEMPAVIVRPSAVYGPHDRDFRAMFALARRGLAIHPGNRAQWISIIHVHDCAEMIVAAATHDAAVGHTYFLANDDPVQWSTLFEMAREVAGARRLADIEIPLSLVRLGAVLGDGLARLTRHASLLTSTKVALSAPQYWICANDRVKCELGVIPAMTLRDGLAQTYRWYLQNGGL